MKRRKAAAPPTENAMAFVALYMFGPLFLSALVLFFWCTGLRGKQMDNEITQVISL
ncbi:hypothetical protein K8942_05965 [Candidatus Peribacteria bacterium]|nr:MAG: hypothetical protein K8942_05965 [Candidatus Peribacteria bacterium]